MKIPNIEELINKDALRPHVSPEWMTKLSSAEFWLWCDMQADIIRFRGGTSREAIQLHLEAEIKNQESLYQMLKKNKLKPAKKKIIKLGGFEHIRRDKYQKINDYTNKLFRHNNY